MKTVCMLMASAGLVAGCAPQRIPYLYPAEGTAWQVVQGHRMATDSTQGIVASLAWESFTAATIRFQMRIENHRAEPWTFDPALCRAELEPVQTAMPTQLHAYDPEGMIDLYDRRIVSKESEMRSNAGWSAAGSFLDLFGAVADVSTKTKTAEERQAKQKREQEREARAHDRQARASQLDLQHSALMQQRDFLSNTLLRANTLLESQPVGGMLLFPRADQATLWTITCPAREGALNFTFSQTMREP